MGTTIFFLLLFTIGAYSRELNRVHQLEHVVITYQNPDYLDVTIVMKKLDRKTNSVNITINILKEITNLEGSVIVYKFADNVYKPTALRYSGDICMFLNIFYEKHNLQQYKKLENFDVRCPIQKGSYYIRNYHEDDFPHLSFPAWKVKFEFVIRSDDRLIATAYAIMNFMDK
ncbi:uncharacterized protein [Leptinotarsa decemlineata]|uniref:uncharacterized protein n=1 Tax=Leptinotarsa decemlineata TaxID=7539 RepID=UPI003D30C67C